MNTTAKRHKKAMEALPAGLPDARQVIALALGKVSTHLARLMDIRCADENWSDEDEDVDNALELALDHIQQMQAMNLSSYSTFDQQWWRVYGVVNLAEKAFSRKDCRYGNCLNGTAEMFRVLADAIDFADIRMEAA